MIIDRKFFKSEKAFKRQELMCPQIRAVMVYAIEFAKKIGVENPIITETVTTIAEDGLVDRKHDQHRTKVAFDLRVKDWSGEQIDAMKAELDKEFSHLAYVTASGVKQIAFCHGEGDKIHFHCAVNAKYKTEEYKGD